MRDQMPKSLSETRNSSDRRSHLFMAREALSTVDMMIQPQVRPTRTLSEKEREAAEKWRRGQWMPTEPADKQWFQEWLDSQTERSKALGELRSRLRTLLWAHSTFIKHNLFGEAEVMRAFLLDAHGGWRLHVAPKPMASEEIERLVSEVAKNF